MRALTKREKVLIYFTVILLICCIGNYFVVRPTAVEKVAAEEVLAEVKGKKMITEAEFIEAASLRKDFEKGKDYYLTHREDFGPIQSYGRLLPIVQSYLEVHSIVPNSFFITDASLKELELPEPLTANKAEADETKAELFTATLDITANGTLPDFQNMLDQIADDRLICVNTYLLEEEKKEKKSRPAEGETEASEVPIEQKRLDISMNVSYYMMAPDPIIEAQIGK